MRGYLCLAIGLLAIGMAPPATAGNSLQVVVERADDAFIQEEFLVRVDVQLDDPAQGDVESITVNFPRTTVLILEEENIGSGDWEGKAAFDNYTDLEAAIDGIWLIFIVGGLLDSLNSFTLDTSTIDQTHLFGTPGDLSPGDGETGVAEDETLSWTDNSGGGPRTPPEALFVRLESESEDQEANSLADPQDPNYIALSAEVWTPTDLIESGLVEFSVFYGDVDASLVTDISPGPPFGIEWTAPDFLPSYPDNKPFFVLGSETIVRFTVPEPSSVALGIAALATLALLRLRASQDKRFLAG